MFGRRLAVPRGTNISRPGIRCDQRLGGDGGCPTDGDLLWVRTTLPTAPPRWGCMCLSVEHALPGGRAKRVAADGPICRHLLGGAGGPVTACGCACEGGGAPGPTGLSACASHGRRALSAAAVRPRCRCCPPPPHTPDRAPGAHAAHDRPLHRPLPVATAVPSSVAALHIPAPGFTCPCGAGLHLRGAQRPFPVGKPYPPPSCRPTACARSAPPGGAQQWHLQHHKMALPPWRHRPPRPPRPPRQAAASASREASGLPTVRHWRGSPPLAGGGARASGASPPS